MGDLTVLIVALEKQATPEHRNKLVGALAAKQSELDSHDKNKPAEVPKPEESDKQKDESKKLSQQLVEKKSALTKADEELAKTREKLVSCHSQIWCQYQKSYAC